jgi:hypothetical protein
MKYLLHAAVLGVFAVNLAHASALACVAASLHTYDVAGFTCSEAGLTFSNFSFADSGTVTPLLTDSAVQMDPVSTGFDITAPFMAPSGANLDVLIRYTVTGNITGDSLAMAGFAVSGNGSIAIAESLCLGAGFNGANCPTNNVKMLSTFDNSGGIKASDAASFNPSISTLGVAKDLTASGGTGASQASVSLVDNLTTGRVATVPEPEYYLCAGLALVLLARLRKRA